jgi:hypothetical protein
MLAYYHVNICEHGSILTRAVERTGSAFEATGSAGTGPVFGGRFSAIGLFIFEGAPSIRVVQPFSYSIVGPSGSVPFVIANDVLNTTGSLDYEARTTWSLVIKSVDNKG